MNLNEFRQQYPEYNDMPDMDLAHALHGKYYADMPFSEFATGIDLRTPRVDENRVLDTGIKPNEPGWLSTILKQAAEALAPGGAPPQPQQPIEAPNLPQSAPPAAPSPPVAPNRTTIVIPQAPIPTGLSPAHQAPEQALPSELAPAHVPPPPKETNYEDLPTIGGAAAQAPYYTLSALRGALGPVLPALKTMGMDTQGVLDTAIKYWRDQTNKDSWKIPNAGLRLSYNQEGNLRPEIVSLPDVPLKDIAAEIAANVGAVAGPIRAAAGAADLLVNKYLTNLARPLFQSIYRGMITGALTGEGQKDKTLENMAAFGLFEIAGKAADIPEAIVNSTTWRRMTIPERGLVLQSLDDTMARNPTMTEAEILRRYNNPTWINEAIKKRSVSEAEALGRDVSEPAATIMAGTGKAAIEPVMQTEAPVPLVPPETSQVSPLSGRRFLQPPPTTAAAPEPQGSTISPAVIPTIAPETGGLNAERLRGNQGEVAVSGQIGPGGQVGGRGDLEQVPQGQPGDQVQRPEAGPVEETGINQPNAYLSNMQGSATVPPMVSRKGPGDITTKEQPLKPEGGKEPKWHNLDTEDRLAYFDPNKIRESGNYRVWDFDNNEWHTFKSKIEEDAFREEYPFLHLAELPADKEKTWYRYGRPPVTNRSFDYANNNGENGVSAYSTPEGSGGSVFFSDRDIYSGKGAQVGWGSDGEPIIIPTGKWKKVSPNAATPPGKAGISASDEQAVLEPAHSSIQSASKKIELQQSAVGKTTASTEPVKSFDGLSPADIEKSIGRPLSEVEVNAKFRREKDGREVTVKQPADEALKTIDEQIDMVKRVLDCMEK